jgi:hypothetical protein
MTDEMRDDDLTGALARSVDVLREEAPVRTAWRAALLARIEADRGGTIPMWRMRPAWAIAAGLVLLMGGAVAGRYWRAPSTTQPVVAAPSTSANIRFVYVAPGAATVSVVGDFNQWNPTAMPLHRLSDGTWIVDVPLRAGRYAYAFMVDGKIVVDPAAPRADGEFGENSILMVRGS